MLLPDEGVMKECLGKVRHEGVKEMEKSDADVGRLRKRRKGW